MLTTQLGGEKELDSVNQQRWGAVQRLGTRMMTLGAFKSTQAFSTGDYVRGDVRHVCLSDGDGLWKRKRSFGSARSCAWLSLRNVSQ